MGTISHKESLKQFPLFMSSSIKFIDGLHWDRFVEISYDGLGGFIVTEIIKQFGVPSIKRDITSEFIIE